MHRFALPLAAGLFGFAQAAGAVSFDSTIYATQSGATTVDFWSFTVHSPGVVTFDLRSWEDNFGGGGVDLNADGEFAFLDTMIWLFDDDGVLGTDDLVVELDDVGAGVGLADGSLPVGLDPYLSQPLAAGAYILAVGSCCDYGADTILDGLQEDGNVYTLFGGALRNQYGAPPATHGDYRIAFAGDLTVDALNGDPIGTPEPHLLGLLGLGLAGTALLRRRRSR